MIDEKLICYLNTVITYCDNELKVNPNTHYVICITVLQTLVYCLEHNEIDNFNTILKYIKNEKSDYISSFTIIKDKE